MRSVCAAAGLLQSNWRWKLKQFQDFLLGSNSHGLTVRQRSRIMINSVVRVLIAQFGDYFDSALHTGGVGQCVDLTLNRDLC